MPVPIVSVVTASHRPNPAYLQEAYDSLCAQSLSSWEWLLQLDGDGSLVSSVPPEVLTDERVRLGVNGLQLGAALTRNSALSSARGEVVVNLDADDTYLPAAFELFIAALEEHPGAGMVFGRNLALHPDGTLVPSSPGPTCPYPLGLLPPGTIVSEWLRTSRHHTSCSHAAYRRSMLLAVGGWGALQRSQDLLMLFQVTERFEAVFLDDLIGHYRIHPDQSTSTSGAAAEVLARRFIATGLLLDRHLRGMAVEWEYRDRDGVLHAVPPA